MRYHIGTSGWQYDHWRRRFYPQGLPKARWFEHYAREFATVELNNTFYRQPKAATWQKWQEAAPPGFCYAVKANRFITHIKRFRDCEAPLKRFFEGAQALGEHLGPVLFQTPPNFHRDDENLERLDGFLELLPQDVSSVFEFRHESWFDDDAGVKLLDRHRVGFCVQDYPGLECPVVATGDFAYVRFHGAARGTAVTTLTIRSASGRNASKASREAAPGRRGCTSTTTSAATLSRTPAPWLTCYRTSGRRSTLALQGLGYRHLDVVPP